MKYTDMFFEAIEKNELCLFLKGDKEYRIETSQYVPSTEPTDVSKVLSDVVYKAYEMDSGIKERVEETLFFMLEQTDYDVYIVILYIMSQLFKEKNGLSPFTLNLSYILPKLREEVIKRRESLKNGIVYPGGFVGKFAWDEMERFRCICKQEYGVQLF